MSVDVSAQSLFNVNGLVAVVTGGGTGIGFMIARALALNGAKRVYIIGRRTSTLQNAASAIDPNIVIPLTCDVTSQTSLLDLASHIETESSAVNLVVANAGIMGPRPHKSPPGSAPPSVAEYRARALNTPMEEFTNTYAVNCTSVYYTALAFLSLLDAGNKTSDIRSQIIATSSIAGFSRLAGASFAYSSSKAAVTHMMKMMATAFAPFGIRANVLAPGLFPSELTGGIIGAMTGGREDGSVDTGVIPEGRVGEERDVAGAVLYVASRAGAYLNGVVVVVDGGRLGVLPSTY